MITQQMTEALKQEKDEAQRQEHMAKTEEARLRRCAEKLETRGKAERA